MSKLHAAAILVIPAAFALAGSFEYPGLIEEPAPWRETASETFQVKLDLARGRRWELAWDGVYAYDMGSGNLLRHVPLPGAVFSASRDSALPDMIVSRSGAVIVSSNARPRVWRVSPARFEVEIHDLQLDADDDKDFGFANLAWAANERMLRATATPLGSEWKIDLATGAATKSPSARPLLQEVAHR